MNECNNPKKSFLEKMENKFYLGITGVVLTAVFGIVALYGYLNAPRASILFEIINESNVLDVHKPLEDLTVFFENENIKEKNLNLRIITVQISNNGIVDILQSHYDQNMMWGFKINNGKIINNARLISTNSDYLRNNLLPSIVGENIVELKKVILEKEKFFSIEILVLHSKDILPEITHMGKIVGIENIVPVKTWEQNLAPSFWGKFFYGGLLINILRPIILVVLLFLFLVVIAISADKIGDLKKKSKKKIRKKEITSLLGNKSEDENFKFLADFYINFGLEGVKAVEELINDPEELVLDIKRAMSVKDYEDKKKESKRVEGERVDDVSGHIRLVDRAEFCYFYEHKYLQKLLEKGILKLDTEDKLIIDAGFKEALSDLTNRFEKRHKKRNRGKQ